MFDLFKSISFKKCEFKSCGISIFSLMDKFEEIATEHAEILGVGFSDLINVNKIWVITKLKIEVLDTLKENEEYCLKTFVRDRGKFDCDRHFEISKNNKVFVRAVYNWCLIDVITRKICGLDVINYPLPLRNFKDNSLKINFLDFNNLNLNRIFVVDKNCLDKNGHMNNKIYGKLIDSIIDTKFKTIIINFEHEAKLSDEIKLNYQILQENCKIRATLNNCVCFCSLIDF